MHRRSANWFVTRNYRRETNLIIEDGTCSWKVVSHQTTITGECLKSHGFVSSCESDPLIPFTSSAQVCITYYSQVETHFHTDIARSFKQLRKCFGAKTSG